MAVGGDKFVGSLTQFAAHRGNGFCVRFAFFLPRSAFFPAEAVLQIQGCTAVTVENVMGGGAFQGVIVFAADVVAPKRLRKAVEALYPGVKFGIGPAIETGFYYDVDFGGKSLVEADLKAIEEKMIELARQKNAFVRTEVSKEEALKTFTEKGDEYKCELISELEDGTITFYTNGDFTDFLQEYRINSVVRELNNNEKECIMDIASRCGFVSQSYFYKVFKKFKGVTPQEYRENYQRMRVII